MTSAKALRLIACALGLALATACGDACLSLADQVCSCQPDSNSKALCNQKAKTAEGIFPVGSMDAQLCQQKLDAHTCDCSKLITAEGRAACGLVITSP
jgi:hypothetical protein